MKNAMGVELSDAERTLVECYQGLVRVLKDGRSSRLCSVVTNGTPSRRIKGRWIQSK